MVDFATPTDATLDRLVACILERVHPELILLFGSRAAGTARDDSDYDILLVLREADAGSLEQARRAASQALSDIGVSADVLAHSIEDYERRQTDPGFIDYLVAREGRLLYARGTVPQRSNSAGRVREGQSTEGFDMWLRRADGDLHVAEISLAAVEAVCAAISFHSHACVEKLLKALIVRAGSFPPRTHDLRELLARQQAGVRSDETIAAACRILMDLLPKARYPELPEPSADEARAAIAAAREVRRVLSPHLARR